MKEIPTNLKREAIERKDSINLSWYQQDVFSRAENFLKSGEFPQGPRIFSRAENFLKSLEFSQDLRIFCWEYFQKLKIFSKAENFFKELRIFSRAENFFKSWEFFQGLRIFSRADNLLKSWEFFQEWKFSPVRSFFYSLWRLFYSA